MIDITARHKWLRSSMRSFWPILPGMFALGALGCTQLLNSFTYTPDVAKFTYDQYDIITGPAQHQTVLLGSFVCDAMTELAVLSTDENGDHRLRIYALGDTNWAPVIDTRLRSELLFVDVGKIGGRDRLISYETGRLYRFDPDTKTEHVLTEVAMEFKRDNESQVPHVDITRDLNHDGRDDLIVPDVNGIWIATQTSDGSFDDFTEFGPPEPRRNEMALGDSRSYEEVGITAMTVPWYLSRVREMDYNHDGRTDLVFWNEDHFDVYLQNGQGRFAAQANSFTVNIPFDADGDYTLAFGFTGESTFALISGFRKKSQRTMLHALRDINGDDVADLVTLTLSGRSIAKQRSVYQVYFGKAKANSTVFARDVSTTIRARGRAGGMQPWGYASQSVQDLDGDGQDDLVFGHVSIGLGGMMRAMLCKSIAIDLEFYCPKQGNYPDKPTTLRRIRPDLDPLYDGVFFPPVLLGDVNGDGRSDLLAGKNPNELRVFMGVPGPKLFAGKGQKLAVELPADERNARLAQLNRDGKQDLLIHHPSSTEPHRVTTLISR